MEYLDILDTEGNNTGEKKLRSLVHKDGDWHKSVHVWITNSQGQVLFQKRSSQKESHPDKWDISFAGHVSAGDTGTITVIREAKEELGLEISEKDFEALFIYKTESITNNGMYLNNQFNDVYLLKMDLDISKVVLQKEEVSEVKWFNLDQIKSIYKNKPEDFVSHPEEYGYIIRYLENKE